MREGGEEGFVGFEGEDFAVGVDFGMEECFDSFWFGELFG